ncbi:flagellar motor switch protein FliM [Nocardioides euryhalodurans]|uniref:Flagellar motor switch protein FliM n=1 Tax=Nocardioides euryhalodurans TaxID=2518370 RepID=A0A4V1BDU9_9ACTN|nr:flagellar motor switch protein FliM [Nocardioides euryhalodurans]QBR92382.1 flagellar motor switch protein FliM [Nocardioides euryhalodurans]
MSLFATAPRPASAAARTRRRARASEPTVYDFRRPIQLSREHSRILQLGLSGLARQATTVFTSSLRTVCTVQLLSIAQETYAEYVDSLNAPTYLLKFSAEPMSGLGVLEIPLPAIMSCVDHMLGGPGSAVQPVRPLTDIEGGVVRGLVERLLGEMQYSLAGVVEIDPKLTGIEYSPQFAQVAGAADVMVVATFDLRIGDRAHRMSICLPFSGLQPHLVKAAAPAPVSERERAQRARAADLVHRQFEQVPVQVSVTFRPTRLGPDSLGGLAVGDVLRLSHPASAPLDVTVDDTTFAHATPGTQGARLAALIVGTPEEKR